MFTIFYYFIALILFIIATPFLLLFSLKKKYRKSLPARFFLLKNPPLKKKGVYFHVCSLGEAKSIKPLVNNFNIKDLRFTAITNTGFNEIKKYSNQSRYLPFEIFLPFWLKEQKALIVIEAELWYMLFWTLKKKGAKTFLINARISEKSYSKYLKFKWFYKKIFENIDFIYAQTKEDKKRLKSLGAKNIKITGNIKLASIVKVNKNYTKRYDLIVTAASTHQNEEELILNAFFELKKKNLSSQLIIAPRHPERFKSVKDLIEKNILNRNLSFSLFSEINSLESDIVLIDTLGELINIYNISDIVIIGGTFEKIGGHNAVEAAQFNCKIISGKYFFNQKDIFNSIENINIVDSNELFKVLLNHKNLKKSKIKHTLKIDKIIGDIKSVL